LRFGRLFAALLFGAVPAAAGTPQYTFQIVRVYPHDPRAFTQGLEFRDGTLYEGTGLNGRSTLRREKLENAQTVESIDLSPAVFGEGITVLGSRIFQLTWQSHEGYVYERAQFRKLRSFSYSGEGWGLANDGKRIYMSDGTAEIRCLDPETLRETRRFTVHDETGEVMKLNELEWVKGEILANIWGTDRIARISPKDGKVLGWIDLSGLLPANDRTDETDVLNGIAYDATGDRLFVTGKLWPKLFQIKLLPQGVRE
jgi:glutaminyl-peptide cyclotransferase